MSRDDYDIPEVFRRAMAEAGWDTERKRNEGSERPPLPPRPPGNGRPNRVLWLAAALMLLMLLFSWLAGTYTEWLWFTAVGYSRVWLTQWGARLAIFVVFFLVALVILLLNWHMARRRAIKHTPPFNPKFLQIPGMNWLMAGVGFLVAFGFAGTTAARWADFLRYLNRVPFGTVDPIFNKDLSFYLFELPIYSLVQQWAVSLLVTTLIGVIVIYAANHIPEIQRGLWRPHESTVFRQHVALLSTFILTLWLVGYIFDRYELLYAQNGVVYGAGYTDMNVKIQAIYAQMLFLALATVVMLLNLFHLRLRPLLFTAVLWLAVTLILGGLAPGLVQRYLVEPNQLVRETPYITHNIRLTRLGFGLDAVQTRPYDLGTPLTQQELSRNAIVLRNIRLWDYRPLQSSYEQLQALRTYYQIGEIDVDRYRIDGEIQQVMLAGRELNKAQMESQTWVNQNLVFTHGYGVVMTPVDRFTTEGQPEFFIKDLPPQSVVPEIQITRPEIYFGELTQDAVFVNSRQEEFDYPEGNENAYTRYAGTGGVLLDSYFKRLAFTIRLGDLNVLLSNDIDNATQLMLHRQIQERVSRITPFLLLDKDPYLVVTADGRLVWVQDAYTISNRLPYSQPGELRVGNTRLHVNYVRNAVKITIDAYEGDVSYYITDPDDPLILAFAGAFPGVFKPLSEMPADLRNHLRYPIDLLNIQATQYLRYHMLDARVFYNREDVWAIPREIYAIGTGPNGETVPVEPYYVVMPLPGSTETEYLLIQPFTPAGKDNMIAWMAARNDEPHYGELIVYELPKQELVFGPLQIEARIGQETEISQQFALWNQQGSRVIRGNLLVIPMNGRFLYVEPVYLESQTGRIPELKRVIVATDARIAMETTLAGALASLLDLSPAVVAAAIGHDIQEMDLASELVETGGETGETPAASDPNLARLIASANTHFAAAQAAQRAGDWATYGVELEALQESLVQLLEMSPVEP